MPRVYSRPRFVPGMEPRMSIEFVPGRKYILNTAGRGLTIATFRGMVDGKLEFAHLAEVDAFYPSASRIVTVPQADIADAEPWLQQIALVSAADSGPGNALIAAINSRKAVMIARPTPAEWKQHTQS